MTKSLLISYFRSLYRNKTTTFINLFGLALGLASCFIILLFVIDELNMDHFQKNRKTVYRIISQDKNQNSFTSKTPFLLGPSAKQEFPDTRDFARIISIGNVKVKKDNQFLEEENFRFADASLLNMLTFTLVEGSNNLSGINNAVISKSIAKKYFGNTHAIGRTMLLSIKGEEQPVTICGVFADLPENTSMKFSFIGNIDFGKHNLMKMLITYSSGDAPPELPKDWDDNFYGTLVQLPVDCDIDALTAKLNNAFKKYQPREDNFQYAFQRYDKIYLHSEQIAYDEWNHGKPAGIFIFSAIALLILVIACFNYLILSLAQSEKRAKEIGIRKAGGADFRSLARQVVIESFTFSLVALPIAIGLSELLLPLLNLLLDKKLVIHYTGNLEFIAGIILITTLISLISGLYLAVYLNRFNPVQILRGSRVGSGTRSIFLKSLVIGQIAIFIALIISSVTIFKQMNFVKTFDLGLDPRNVVSVSMRDVVAQQNCNAFREELRKIPEIQSFGTCMFVPPSDSRFTMVVPRVDDPKKNATLEFQLVDYGFIETMGLTLKEGRTFSQDFPSDAKGIVLTESAVQELGLKETIGTKLDYGTVIGVVKDFHIHDLHSKLAPAYFTLSPQFFYMVIKTRTNPANVLPKIKSAWERLNPDIRFESELLTTRIEDQYLAEKRFSLIILLFTIVAIVIASMGLFGLSGFITLLRTKEIGIRKVNGGTVAQMLLLLSREIFGWTSIAFIIAVPAAWYAMHQWLENFAYKTSLSWWIFVAGGIAALMISLISVSWQAYRAASRNPVEALRYE